MTLRQRLGNLARRVMFMLAILGPGLITASADNDAPGIAAYSMAGSTYGYQFLWILLWITVGEIAVQEVAARMGAATGKGLTDLIRERFGLKLTFLVTIGILLANSGTTAAQFAGVASSSELFGVSRYLAVPAAALSVWLLVTRGSYRRVEKVLLVLSLYAVAYVISAFMAQPPWGQVLREAVVPTIHINRGYMLAVLAVVGTTITPWGAVYMQASIADKGVTMASYRNARWDVIIGAAVGNVVSAFIVIATAATLFPRGIRVTGAEEAAMALVPVAGPWAEILFGAGLMGASLLAASVLPLATTYAICEVFGWERGIDRSVEEAPLFYGLYTAQIVVAAIIVLIPGLKLFRLMWLSQVANAVLLPVILVLMLRLANNPRVMKSWRNTRVSNVAIIVMTALVCLATLALFVAS